ncbi:MAG: hypothetical protein ABI345_15110 [Jatrophihabitans sp.]
MTTTITRSAVSVSRRFIVAAPATYAPWSSCVSGNAHAAVASVPNFGLNSVDAVRVGMNAAASEATAPAGIGSDTGRTQGSPPRGEPR